MRSCRPAPELDARSDRLLGAVGLAALIEAHRRRADEPRHRQGRAGKHRHARPHRQRRRHSRHVGGASVGERDLVAPRFAPRARARFLEDRHAARQAPPLWPAGQPAGARRAGQPGLGADLRLVFLVPMLRPPARASRGDAPEPQRRSSARRSRPTARASITCGRVSTWRPRRERVVTPLRLQDSSLVADFARADCLIVRPPRCPCAPARRAGDEDPLDAARAVG